MATPKKPTRAELEKQMQQMQADLLALKREKEMANNNTRPVLYLMRAGKDAKTYVVGSAEYMKTMPAAPAGAEADAEGIYYKSLDVGADFASLAAELERCLARFKSPASDGTGGSYAVPFEEGKMWLDFVAGRAELESIDDALQRQEFLRRTVAVFADAKRAKSGLSDRIYEIVAGGATAGGATAPAPARATNSAKKDKEAKKTEETEKIARFVEERCVLDADAPLVSKDEVLGVYRIWAKGTTFYSNSLLIDYVREELNLKVSHIGPAKDGILAFKGIALKMDDWKYDPAPGGPAVKRFLQEKCLFGPTEKTFSRGIMEAYSEWRKEKEMSTLHPTDLNRELRENLKACPIVCAAASITLGSESAAGWHGIGLIGEKDSIPTPTRKIASFKAGKVVERRMPGEGGEVLESWPSVTQAAKALNLPMYRIQARMRTEQPDDDGAILVFAKDKSDGPSTSSA